MVAPPTPTLPPPPTGPRALGLQRLRIQRRRWLQAVFLAAIFVTGGITVWVLSRGEVPRRSEWAYAMTHVDGLQARGLDGTGQVVCLVDTGIDVTHPDLRGTRILGWHDFVNNATAPYDDDGHGTAMAGILAARGSLTGVAPGISLVVAKMLDAQGRGTSAGLAAAVDFCLDPLGDGSYANGADVISLSLGAAKSLPVGSDVTASVNRAVALGVVIVAAAGNDGLADNGDVQSPSSMPEVIAVGAFDSFGAVAPFSSIGADAGRTDPNRKPELVAPGVDLLTTARGGGYRLVGGTSASAAFVSGIVALLLQARPALARSGSATAVLELKTAFMLTAVKAPGQITPHDPHYGYGGPDAAATLAALP